MLAVVINETTFLSGLKSSNGMNKNKKVAIVRDMLVRNTEK